MYENRIREQFAQKVTRATAPPYNPFGSQSILSMVSLSDIYQAAAARAAQDHELDKLFNPEYYHDQGSGI